MSLAAVIGYIGGALVAMLQLPQVLHTRKNRDTSGLSAASVGVHLVTGAVWIFYGVLIHETPIIVANGVYLGCNVYLLRCLFAQHRAPTIPPRPSTPTIASPR